MTVNCIFLTVMLLSTQSPWGSDTGGQWAVLTAIIWQCWCQTAVYDTWHSWSTFATSSRSGNIVAGVVLAVHANWDKANRHDITSQVLLTGPNADIPGARVCQHTSALHHQDGQLVANSRLTASLTEACNCYSEKNGAGFIWHEQLSPSFQPVM